MRFYPDGYEFAIFEEDFIEYYDPDDETQESVGKWAVMGPWHLTQATPDCLQGIVIELEIGRVARSYSMYRKNRRTTDFG